MIKLKISLRTCLISMMLALIIAMSDINGTFYTIGVNFVNPNYIVDHNFTLRLIIIFLIISLISFLFMLFFITKLLRNIKNELTDIFEE